MQCADHRLACIGSHLGQRVFQSLASRSEAAKWGVDSGTPVSAGDEFARHNAAVSRQPRLMQPEGKLDDIGNAVAVHAFAALILERLHVAARCQEPQLEMLNANNAKMLGA